MNERNHDPYKSEMKDPEFIEQNRGDIEIKVENMDPDFIQQDHYQTEVKEEDQDPEFMEQNTEIKLENMNEFKIEVKEGNLNMDFIKEENQDMDFKEENQDMDFIKEENQDMDFKEENQDLDFIKEENQDMDFKEENQDLDFKDQNQDMDFIKEENQDLDFIKDQNQDIMQFMHQDQYNVTPEIKVENQDLDLGFILQDRYESEVKEENLDPGYVKEDNMDMYFSHQDHYKSDIKEENLDPMEVKLENEDPEHRDTGPAGPAHQQCQRHQLVFTTVSLDKCAECVGPVCSFNSPGFKCTVCSGVWHKSCLKPSVDENHEDVDEQPCSDDELQDPQLESNNTEDDQCLSSEEDYADSDDDGDNSDESVPPVPSPSKTGKAKAVSTDVTVKLNLSNTEDEDNEPCVTETSESSTPTQQTKDDTQEHLSSSTPVTTNNINYCYVCGKPRTKIARHLKTHKTHPEVEQIFSLPSKSKERKRLLEKLRNKGNFKHNSTVLQSGTGSLKVKRQTKSNPTAGTFIHCMYCKGMYLRKELWRHVRRCPERPDDDDDDDNEPGVKRILGIAAAVESPSCQEISNGVWKLISIMKEGEVASVVRNDFCILQFAQALYEKNGQDPSTHEYLRQKLREVGRLLLCLRRDFAVHNIEDAIKPANFDQVVQAVKKVSGYDEAQHTYQTPSLILKLGHTLRKISDIVLRRALVVEDKKLIKSTETFNRLYKSKWPEVGSHSALNTVSDAKHTKPSTLPFAKDVQILHHYLEKSAESAFRNLKEKATVQNYTHLTKVTLTRIVVFNRRRVNEITKIRLKSFAERDEAKSHEDVDTGLSKVEQMLGKYFTRLEILGKRYTKVSVLLTPSMLEALSLLTSKRAECGVCNKNIFLFAQPKSLTHCKGHNCLRVLITQCGAKHPEHLMSVQLRKHLATLSQMLSLKHNELIEVADLMGYNIRVHQGLHRLPIPTTHLAKISKMLLSMEKGQVSSMQGKSLGKTELEDEISSSDEENNVGEQASNNGSAVRCGAGKPVDAPSAVTDEDDEARDSDEGVAEEHSSRRKKKKAWSEPEIAAVMQHFQGHILKGKLASTLECRQCQLAEHPALDGRTVQNIRDFVRNRGVATKRQPQKLKL